MRISDLSSDVCSSDLLLHRAPREQGKGLALRILAAIFGARHLHPLARHVDLVLGEQEADFGALGEGRKDEDRRDHPDDERQAIAQRSGEHTSELQSLMRISYAVFCLKKKKKHQK